MPARPLIAVIGSANTDLITYSDAFPQPGETLFGKSFHLGFGGKGANQAMAAKLCGADVTMVAKVGNDLFGEATVRNFASAGIDTTHVSIVQGLSSGVAPIFVDSNGQNRIIVVKGANDALTPHDVDAAAESLKRANLVVLQFEIPLETVIHAAQFAKKNGIRCIVNPAPAVDADLTPLTAADYFVPNENEAEAIARSPLRSTDDAKACAARLRGLGFRKVIITMGERGCLFAEGAVAEVIPPYSVTPQDTTGAGDAFVGSFAVFLAEGLAEREALARANLYAALSTTRIGTQCSYVTRAVFDAEWTRRAGVK